MFVRDADSTASSCSYHETWAVNVKPSIAWSFKTTTNLHLRLKICFKLIAFIYHVCLKHIGLDKRNYIFLFVWYNPQTILSRMEQTGSIFASIAAYLPEGEEMAIAEDGIGMNIKVFSVSYKFFWQRSIHQRTCTVKNNRNFTVFKLATTTPVKLP